MAERGPRWPTTGLVAIWRWPRSSRLARVGLGAVVLIVLVAVLADLLAPYPYDKQNLAQANLGPSPAHWLGTDGLGRDLLSRLLIGARLSMAVALIDAAIIVLVGVPLGLIAGYFGRWLDGLIMRLVDILYALPSLLLIILVMTSLRTMLEPAPAGPLRLIADLDQLSGGLLGIFIALGLVSWLTVARLVRAQVMALKEREFIEAARVSGASDLQILWRHLLPNTLAPVIVATTLSIPTAIVAEAGLSYLGLGVRPPLPSWGILIADGVSSMRTLPHLLLVPGSALAATLVAFTLVGDGLRDALDPRLR